MLHVRVLPGGRIGSGSGLLQSYFLPAVIDKRIEAVIVQGRFVSSEQIEE